MRIPTLFASALPLAALSLLGGSTIVQDQGSGGLQRLEPLDEPSASAQTPREFDPEQWNLLLEEQDLDRREESFDRLVRRARRDPEARAYLKELAADADRPALAWTARLALRELGRTGTFGFYQALPFDDPAGPFGERIEDMLQGFGFGLPQDLRDWHADLFQVPPGGQGLRQEGRSMSLQQGPDGWELEITEEVDGEKRTRTFQGESLEEILQQNPELEAELGISGRGLPGRFQLRLGPGGDHLRELFGKNPFQFRSPDGQTWLFNRRAPSEPLRTDILGVRVVPLGTERSAELELPEGVGLYVSSTYPATIAQLLGVRAGDVLVELNGQQLASSEDITRILEQRAQDGELSLTWIDGAGERRTRTWKPEAPREEHEERDF